MARATCSLTSTAPSVRAGIRSGYRVLIRRMLADGELASAVTDDLRTL
jgi:hypothetical protein